MAIWQKVCSECGHVYDQSDSRWARSELYRKSNGRLSDCCQTKFDIVEFREKPKPKAPEEGVFREELPERYLPYDPKAVERQQLLWAETLKWVRENPRLWDLYKQYALEASERWRRFSISLLTERVRWEAPTMENGHPFKISNSYRRYIAILLISLYPELKEKIRVKERIPKA